MDDDAIAAMSAVLEHDFVQIDAFTLIIPAQLVTEEMSYMSNRNKCTFEAIINEFDNDYLFNNYGEGIIYGGSGLYLPPDIIDASI